MPVDPNCKKPLDPPLPHCVNPLCVTDFFWNGLIIVSNTRVCPTKGTPKENPWPFVRSGDARNTYQANGRMGYCQHRKGGGRGKIRGWHYSTNCGNGSKVGLSGPDDCMEIDPTVTPQDLLCPPPDILKVGNPILNILREICGSSLPQNRMA